MIKTFRHKGLKKLFETGEARGVRADQVSRIEEILSILAVAETMQAFGLRSFRLHPLKASSKGFGL